MTRIVTANLSITLDGRYHGPEGPADMGPIIRYATTEVARRHLTRIWEEATTAVLGRRNAEGLLGFWPSVASDEKADPRDRAYANWLVEAEKVVFSRTLKEAPWKDTHLVMICPEMTGGGPRVFDDGLPPSGWTLTHQQAGEKEELALVYDRAGRRPM